MAMARKRIEPVEKAEKAPGAQPMLKTVDQMSRICGIGENRLRDMMDRREIDYVSIGNRRLLTEAAIWDWYDRCKTKARDDRDVRRVVNGNLREKYSEQER